MNKKDVLVSGAGIAGLTMCYWLNHYGFRVTLIERFPGLRLGGQNIDVKGPALEIAKKMNLLEEIRAANTTEQGMKWVNTNNQVVAEFPKEDALSMTQEHEILRGDLLRILFDRIKEQTTVQFGQQIVSLKDEADKVWVSFADGKQEKYDLVISAEGIGSKTRDLVLGDEVKFDYKGVYTSYFTVAKTSSDSAWARWCNALGGIVFLLRPDNYGSTRASITFLSGEKGYEKLSLDEQKKLLISKIHDAGWESGRLVKEIERSTDIYLDRVSQVRVASWSKGRVVIVGDAAWCATPLAGKGTDLAMSGAYILAGELSKTDDHSMAFKNYEDKMRPYAESCQRLPPGVPRLVYPTSRPGLAVLNGIVSLIGSKPVKSMMRLFKKKGKESKSEFNLPHYD
jgi:2-polyprenyl-6-methoxyphenol hydroxylase-like FAD-dependent oxidoreductase